MVEYLVGNMGRNAEPSHSRYKRSTQVTHVCPRAPLAGEVPDPVGIISATLFLDAIRSGAPNIACCRGFAGRGAEAHGQAIGIFDRVNLAGQSAS
jgi:hypothetical protein